MNPTSYQLLNHLPWETSSPTTKAHLGIAHNSTGPPKPSACVVGTEPCRCLSSRLLAHRSGLRTNITRSEAAKACLRGREATHSPGKMDHGFHGKRGRRGKKRFQFGSHQCSDSIVNFQGCRWVMGDDSHVFFWSWVCAKRTWREVGKWEKMRNYPVQYHLYIPLWTSKNQFAIFISLALRHETRNKNPPQVRRKKNNWWLPNKSKMLKPGKKEKKTTTKTPFANYAFICQLRSLKPAVFRIILWLPLLKEMGTLGF